MLAISVHKPAPFLNAEGRSDELFIEQASPGFLAGLIAVSRGPSLRMPPVPLLAAAKGTRFSYRRLRRESAGYDLQVDDWMRSEVDEAGDCDDAADGAGDMDSGDAREGLGRTHLCC